eukprot:6554857-Prymnesium_polylepis.1
MSAARIIRRARTASLAQMNRHYRHLRIAIIFAASRMTFPLGSDILTQVRPRVGGRQPRSPTPWILARAQGLIVTSSACSQLARGHRPDSVVAAPSLHGD